MAWMVPFLFFPLLPISVTNASCVSTRLQCSLYGSPAPVTLPAVVEDSDDNEGDEDVFGPDTPTRTPETEQNGTHVAQLEPWHEFERAIARLWEEGQEHTVYMMASYLRAQLLTCPGSLREAVSQAASVIRPYDDGGRRTFLPPWWRIWLDLLLERWRARLQQPPVAAAHAEGEEAALMQHAPAPWRPELWKGLLLQIRGVVARRLRQWLKQQLDNMAPDLVVLGGMMADVERENPVQPAGSDEERAQGVSIGDTMVEMLGHARQAGALVRPGDVERAGPAVRDAARDVALRSDRWDHGDQIPIDDSWESFLEDEELKVGAAVTKWVRDRLPKEAMARRRLFLQVIEGLRLQVAQECRHLRRLHMGLEQLYCMGEGGAVVQGSVESIDALPQDAKDLIDQIIMNIGNYGQERRRSTVLDMLQGADSTASSSATPPSGSIMQEGEALRRWLNGVFEGSLSELLDDHLNLTELGGLPDTCDKEHLNVNNSADDLRDLPADLDMEDDTLRPAAGDAPDGGDDTALVQRPPWERTSKRGRSRSRSRERRSWRSADATGWTSGATGSDGNDHRPWRRTAGGQGADGRKAPSAKARPSRGAATPSALGSGAASAAVGPDGPTDHSRLLGTVMGPQAWQCLLDMRSPMDPVADWGYGLPTSARANVESSYGSMTDRERQIMHLELLRVMAAILTDVAQAMQNVLSAEGELREAEPDEGDEEEADGDGHCLVQKLPPAKARRLEQASAKEVLPDPASDILGTSFDKLSRSMMASLERMSSSASARCAQSLLDKLVVHYGTDQVHLLPDDAQALLSGLVTFGAGIGSTGEALESMDSFYTEHWWNLVLETLPPASTMATTAATTPPPTGTGAMTATGSSVSDQANEGVTWALQESQGAPIDLNDTLSLAAVPEGAQRSARAHGHAGDVQPEGDAGPAARGAGGVWLADDMQRAMVRECERFRAAQLQEWEDRVMQEALQREPLAGVGLVLRGGVVGVNGVTGTTQSMAFRLLPGETLSLRLAVEAPEGELASTRWSRMGEEQG